MKKKNAIGACVLTAAIVLAVPLGVHTSLTKLREDAENTYYYDNAGYAIYEGVEERQATANNLITVAERYTSENPALTELIGDLEYTVRLAQNSYDDFAEEAQANQMMTDAAQALYDELKNTQLSEEDAKYPDQLLAQMKSEQDKINRSSYTDEAREFHARLGKFPVNLLLPLVGVEPLATYNQE